MGQIFAITNVINLFLDYEIMNHRIVLNYLVDVLVDINPSMKDYGKNKHVKELSEDEQINMDMLFMLIGEQNLVILQQRPEHN